MPHYIAIGLSEEFVNESCPKDLEVYDIAHSLKLQEQDRMSWISGLYFKSALETVLNGAFGGKSNVRYTEHSIMDELNKYAGMTQEEIDEIEIRRMVMDEEKWRIQQINNGMKEI